jgi:simple sugar transport system permease protein
MQYIISILLTFAAAYVLIAAQGESPTVALKQIAAGAFGSLSSFANTIRWMTPCLMTGTAAMVAFKSGARNMGIEGQVYFGALVAAIVGYSFHLPHIPHVALCLFAAALAGAVYAAIPALLRIFFNISDLISSLMLNFIAVLMTDYLTVWVIMKGLQAANGSAGSTTPQIERSAELTTLVKGTTASTGVVIALAVSLLVWFVFNYTVKGYELTQMGRNPRFARQGGVNVARNFLFVFLASGVIAGLSGGIEVSGSYHRFTSNFSKNISWDGIMIARVANNNPIGVVAVSILWGALKAGAMNMERTTSLNRLTVNIIQMLFVLFISIDYRWLLEKIASRRLALGTVDK